MELPFAESYRIKMVENIRKSTKLERQQWLKEADYKLSELKDFQVSIDLVTDPELGYITNGQCTDMTTTACKHQTTVNSPFFKITETIRNIFGFQYVIPTHHGRAPEHIVHSILVNKEAFVLGNAQSDSAKIHLELRKGKAIDCTIAEASDPKSIYPFKGNIDTDKLKDILLGHPKDKISLIIVNVTCTANGGQPVSMKNLKAVKLIGNKFGIPVCYDSTRCAENAYFIKTREQGYQGKLIKEIIKEMHSYADMVIMNYGIDGVDSCGGFIALNDQEVWKTASKYCALLESLSANAEMSQGDMDTVCGSLDEITEFDHLQTRVKQVEYLARKLEENGIAFQKPVGGHAIFVETFQHSAQTLAKELYLQAGIRGSVCETNGGFQDSENEEANRGCKRRFLCLTTPRRTYTNSHMDVVAVALKNVVRSLRRKISNYKVVRVTFPNGKTPSSGVRVQLQKIDCNDKRNS